MTGPILVRREPVQSRRPPADPPRDLADMTAQAIVRGAVLKTRLDSVKLRLQYAMEVFAMGDAARGERMVEAAMRLCGEGGS